MKPLLDSLPASFAFGTWQALAIEEILRATLALVAAFFVGVAMWRAPALVRHLI